MRLFPLVLAASLAAVLLGASAPPDPASSPTPGYAAALDRAGRFKGDASLEDFRANVLMKAVEARLREVVTACRPGDDPPFLGLVFSYRGRRFDRVETSLSTPLARCMAEGLAAKVDWPAPPVDDFALAIAFEPGEGPKPYQDAGQPTPGFAAAYARFDAFKSDPKAEAFRKDVLEKAIVARLTTVSFKKCMPKLTKMKFVLVFSYRDRRFDSIETSGVNPISTCLIEDLKTGIDWPTPPVDNYATFLTIDAHD